MSVARGGQTLLTREAADLLAAAPGTAAPLHSHGHWRLKGIEKPVELFEAVLAGRPALPPGNASKAYRVVERQGRWLTLEELPNTLGAEADRFVGRGDALLELARTFDCGVRLVNLPGTGGVGKTRLAREYARGWRGDHPGGAWFCDLSAARSGSG